MDFLFYQLRISSIIRGITVNVALRQEAFSDATAPGGCRFFVTYQWGKPQLYEIENVKGGGCPPQISVTEKTSPEAKSGEKSLLFLFVELLLNYFFWTYAYRFLLFLNSHA